MVQNRTYLGLVNIHLDGEELCAEAALHAAAAVARRRGMRPGIRHTLHIGEDRRAILAACKLARERAAEALELTPAMAALTEELYVAQKAMAALLQEEAVGWRGLPAMAQGEHLGLPRAYDIAVCLIGHRGGRVDEASLAKLLSAYQSVSPLMLRELAALPSLLRVALIKLIALECGAGLAALRQYAQAEALAAQLGRRSGAGALDRQDVVAKPHLAARLFSILAERDEQAARARLSAQLFRADQEEEALFTALQRADEESAARLQNALKSLRALDAMDWEKLGERFSSVDAALRKEETYARMDARSRAWYRRRVEVLAARLGVAETVVARQAVTLALAQAGAGGRQAEAGHYLLEEGQAALYAALRPDKRCKLPSEGGRLSWFFLLQGALLLPLLLLCAASGWYGAILAFFPAWSIAALLSIRLMLRAAQPGVIPRLDFKEGLPPDCATLVVVPTLITEEAGLRAAIAQLEVHMLATRQSHCVYAVLGDFPDAVEPQKSGEGELLRLARRLVRELNVKYPADTPLFYYLHRRRELHAADGIYMGRERKRGALCDLAELLSTGRCSSFCLVTSPLPRPIKYCLTLDADTVLPPGTLAQLVGAMAHPLNRPVFAENGLVRAGYGVICPRMVSLPRGAAKSPFAFIASGESGLDSYFPLAAEFYQDVFGTGIFGGKGIFDVEAFGKALLPWIPGNTVLSHDLLEGCLMRAGIAEDVALYDSEPSAFIAWWKRQHRWIRGDWQLLPFLRGGIRDALGILRNNPLSTLSRYKIWDNLRRTITPVAALLCLLALPFLGWGWPAALALVALLDSLVLEAVALPLRLLFGRRRLRVTGALRDMGRNAARAALGLLTLPYSACRTLDAQLRTLYRVLFSHRHMLEWQTAAQVKAKPQSVYGYYRALWVQTALGLFMLAGAKLGHAPIACLLLGLVWLSAPLAVAWADQPKRAQELAAGDKSLLLDIARRTWRYFETFAGPESGYLPPDNFQQAPAKAPVANTSPTNIGMGMAACLCAKELGFISGEAMAERIGCMLDTMERMEKWQGHLYNWYRLSDLAVLNPRYVSTVDSGNLAACLLLCAAALEEGGGREAARAAARCRALLAAMDFRPLYDAGRRLFHIGYNESNGQLTRSWYDLMASEARLTSLVAIALGQVESGHWLALSRLLVPSGGGRTLLSWSGTMFEYLMPVLFTGLVPGTLLYESCVNALNTQMRYAAAEGLNWGISESGYYAFDRDMYYQYRAFGVPRLGLMAQHEQSRVISPYSALLALGVPGRAEDALGNIRELMAEGALGDYGMYEALDYSPSRVAKGKDREIVQSYMAHHQGMCLCALTNCLASQSLSRRFLAQPEIRAVQILLEEKQPAYATVIREFESAAAPKKAAERKPHRPRRVAGPRAVPETQLLSNGRYTLFITDSGLGFSKCGEVMLGRWRPDPLRGDGGVHLLLRCGEDAWEVTEGAETILHPHKVEFNNRRGPLSAHAEVCVSAEMDAQVHALTITNHGGEDAEVEVGAFMEVCLAGQREDMAHPAFVRLTVQAEEDEGLLLFWRRQGGGTQRPSGVLYAQLYGDVKPRYATDRLRAQGRASTLAEAMARPLSAGPPEAPVDPYLAARASLVLGAGQSAAVWFLLGYAPSKAKASAQAEELRAGLSECTDLASAHARSALRMAGLSEGKAELFERIAARLLLHIPQKSPRPADAGAGEGLCGLWRLGISGDLPILLMEVKSLQALRRAKTLLELSAYLAARQCPIDLVLIGDYPNAYRGELQTRLSELCCRFPGSRLLHGYELSGADKRLLRDMAMVEADGSPGMSLDKQFSPAGAPLWHERLREEAPRAREAVSLSEAPPLLFDNGWGGLDAASGEYVITLAPGEITPLPWCNILANGGFGALVSETGGGYTFGANSREDKLTPWYNEPVLDPKGEILLLCDEEDGRVFTVQPGRLQAGQARVRHGYGYTAFETAAHGLLCGLTQFVHRDAPCKYSLLTLKNPSLYDRHMSALFAVEWVMGDQPHPESLNLYEKEGTAFAGNLRRPGSLPGYLACPGMEAELCQDRAALLQAGWLAENLQQEPCAYGGCMSGLRAEFTVPAGGECALLFLLGQEEEGAALRRVRESTPALAQAEFCKVKALWRERVCSIEVHTPSESLNALLNGRLLYQTYASRILARTGYYQCGGAIGFRDQLQDMLALLQVEPDRARAHLLLCAGRQFIAGDVLHWWHPPTRGVRTRIVDDRLFLPYVLSHYLEATGDASILDEVVPYLADCPIPEGCRDLYAHMQDGAHAETLYEHCRRAIDSALDFGAHGLPLMKGGDWNDGMDKVGENGGESVWLGWFLLDVLRRFHKVGRDYGKAEDAARYEREAERLEQALEGAWDGAWYKRAYFGNGKPLGSASNDACRIDCISQAWAAICGGAHGAEAMDSLERLLADEQSGVLRLLEPSFQKPTEQGGEVGYITAYLPGVRENGGQYTHGAAWAVLACCALNRPEAALRLFDLLNPLEHTSTRAGAARYMAEPYALAGDVYAPPQGGRGGWSWYTGAAAWLYKIGLEDMLGVRRQGNELVFAPCVPFDSFVVRYGFGSALYELRFSRGEKKGPRRIVLLDDGKAHQIDIVF